ncbi:MAG: glutamate--tRNA ligase [Candidatus Eisenbacteria bacterium]|nr:glutamate--tRNA ligase [Candidatus Eisenbacteria bacterium]
MSSSQQKAQVRVRFAPSPTGFLHVGGLRTALYNYLFARKHGGVFVLRIEDTDRTRYVEGAVETLLESLRWAGLTYDEGPGIGGPCAPYFQSGRLALYREAADRLLASGHAYLCFCTPERIDAVRKARQAAKENPKYDRACLSLSLQEVEAKKREGLPHVVRLRIPDNETIRLDDLVRGEVAIDSEILDDQVLLKSDGFPTYHLANVVDDHAMGVTHVIRGEEWLSSTPKHLILYRALGWDLPQFAHLPLLLGTDRSKLSKRQADVAVTDYRDQGYFPEALVNFVAFLGWNPGDEREIFTLEELVEAFSLDRVGKSGAIFNVEKLQWIQQQYVQRRPAELLVRELRPLLDERGWAAANGFDDAYLARVVDLMRERVTFVREIVERASWFFEEPQDYEAATVAKRWKPETTPALLRGLLPRLAALERFDVPSIERTVSAFAEERDVAKGELIHPLRLACTGVGGGPGLWELMETLGKERCVRRIERALEKLPAA